MHSSAWSALLLTTLFNALFHVECKSYFGIGDRTAGDQLLLRDEVENRYAGLTEVPKIAFKYSIRDPITYIEIVSDENVLADVDFSYYNALINGTVTAFSTTLATEHLPFKVLISIYGFNESMPMLDSRQLLRQSSYNGPLIPKLQPGEIDHMEIINTHTNAGDANIDLLDILDVEDQNESKENANEQDEDDDDNDDEETEIEDDSESEDYDRESTFENMDKLIIVGSRQIGDYLLYETYQTSPTTTQHPSNHSVVFYFIDSVHITYIEFVLIDYCNNKTTKEISDSYMIEYSHFSESTLKAVIRDHKTTSLFAKMSIYGYKPEHKPAFYVSYVPEQARSATESPLITESPEMHLRAQINALQRDGLARLPTSFDMLRREGDIEYTVTAVEESLPSSAISLQSLQMTSPSVMMAMGFVIAVCRLYSSVVLFD